MKEETTTISIGSWLFIQCALLVVHYGFNKTLPWWVLWLPSLLTGILITALLLILLIAFINLHI